MSNSGPSKAHSTRLIDQRPPESSQHRQKSLKIASHSPDQHILRRYFRFGTVRLTTAGAVRTVLLMFLQNLVTFEAEHE